MTMLQVVGGEVPKGGQALAYISKTSLAVAGGANAQSRRGSAHRGEHHQAAGAARQAGVMIS